MKRTFKCHFAFAFTFFLKVAIQWKWKGLSTVILILFSQLKPDWPFCRSFLKVAIQWNQKDFQQSLKSRSDCPFFNKLFWKLQFNENEKIFQLSFWLCFHIFSESRNSTKMKRTFNCNCDFVFTAQARLALLSILIFWKSQFNENENDFQLWFWLNFKAKAVDPFCWSVLKVAIQWSEKDFLLSFWLYFP